MTCVDTGGTIFCKYLANSTSLNLLLPASCLIDVRLLLFVMMQTTGVEKTSDYGEELVSRDDISEHSSSKALSPGISETAPGAQNDRVDLENTLENLHECSWEVLQEKFSTAMETHAQAEQELRDQTAKLLEVHSSWSSQAKESPTDKRIRYL